MDERIPAPRWDFWLRYSLLGALCGAIAGQWLFVLVGLVLPHGFGHLHSILFCAAYVPLLVIPSMLWLVWRRWQRVPSFRVRRRHSDLLWALLGLSVFAAWPSVYYVVGLLVEGRPMTTFSTVLEDHIPFAPGATLIYLTVYWIAALPMFVLPDTVPRRRVILAYAVTLAPCLVAFVVFPVTIGRPVPDPDAGIFAWALAVVHRADPPYNAFPSSHCAMSMMAGLLFFEVDRRLGWAGVLYACTIGVTTLLTKQHYVIDVLAGIALAGAAYWLVICRTAPARLRGSQTQRAG